MANLSSSAMLPIIRGFAIMVYPSSDFVCAIRTDIIIYLLLLFPASYGKLSPEIILQQLNITNITTIYKLN